MTCKATAAPWPALQRRDGGKADAGLLCDSSESSSLSGSGIQTCQCVLACACVHPLGRGGQHRGSQVESPWDRIIPEGDPPEIGGPGAASEEAGLGGSGGISNLPRPSPWPGRPVSGCGGGAPGRGRGRGEGRAGATRAAAPPPPHPLPCSPGPQLPRRLPLPRSCSPRGLSRLYAPNQPGRPTGARASARPLPAGSAGVKRPK